MDSPSLEEVVRTYLALFATALVLLAILLFPRTHAQAASCPPQSTFTVTTTADYGAQAQPIAGSLRKAIEDANQDSDLDCIQFNIAGGGVKTINLVRALPDLSNPIEIDGSSQPGYSGTPLIVINGGQLQASGLVLTASASGSTIKGLAINNFARNGIELLSSDNNVIEGNFIGTNAAGTEAASNGSEGIVIGSLTPDSGSNNNIVRGNLISGNGANGIHISGAEHSTDNVIQGNRIGTDVSGSNPIPNAHDGVFLESVNNNTIGGTNDGEGNIIAFNGRNGIQIDGGTGNTVRRNAIFSNQELGIEVIPTGPNATSVPVITSAAPPPSQARVSFSGDPNTTYTIEFFENSQCDPSGYGEGASYLFSTPLQTDENGEGSVVVQLNGTNITATATGGAGNALLTTEFSACYTGAPTSTRTPTNTATQTRTSTPTHTPGTSTVTSTPTSTLTGTATPTGSVTSTPTAVLTQTPTQTATATLTATPAPSHTPTPTLTSAIPSPTPCTGTMKAPRLVSPSNGAIVFVRRVPLGWNESCGAKTYHIIIREGSRNGPVAQKKKGLTTTQMTTKELKKGKTYYWKVKACKSKKKCTKWSATWKFKVDKNATSSNELEPTRAEHALLAALRELLENLIVARLE